MRVVIGEDSVLLREGVARLLEDAGFDVVAQAGDGDDLLRKVRAHRPDIAIVDIRMPPTHTDEGLRAARTMRSELPGTGILVLSQHADEHYATQLLGGGADGVGYLLKDRVVEVDRFVDAVRRVANGGTALDPEIVTLMVDRRDHSDPLGHLTERELQVLGLIAEGLSNRAIQEQLVLTERAVERHVTSIFVKLNLPATGQEHRRVLAVRAYLEAEG
jgi:DNA-binding NarL/FixJ family response regulator